MSFFAELRRRNVFRVGIAYVVAAWVLLQLTEVLNEILELPAWAPKLVLLLLLVGFIPALIFAWAFEMTPEGLKREKDVDRTQSVAPVTGRKLDRAIIGILVIAVALLLLDRFLPDTGAPANAPAAASAEVGTSIAVLPFVNMSADAENEYFSDGLSEELLNLLAKVDGLKVAARTSSFKFKGADADIGEIGRALGVATVLEGSVRKAGNQARITAQLIKVDDGFHLWSETYDRSLDNIFAVQDEIAGAIVNELKLPLLGTDAAPVEAARASSFEAYDRYLLGRHLARGTNAAAFEEAIDAYQQAIEMDPGFAPAWAGLSDAYTFLSDYGDLPLAEALRLAKEASDRALELDPDSPEAIAAAGLVSSYGGYNRQAVERFRRAIEINPNDARYWRYLSNSLDDEFRYAESLEAIRKAVELDPLDGLAQFLLIGKLGMNGRFDEGEQLARNMIAADAEDPFPWEAWGNLDRRRGHTADAIIHYKRAHELRPDDTWMASWISEAFLNLDDVEGARRWLAEGQKRGAESQWTKIAEWRLLVFEGRIDEHLAVMESAAADQPGNPVLQHHLGLAHLRTGNLEGAREALTRSIEMRGADPLAPTPPTVAVALELAAAADLAGETERRDRLLAGAYPVITGILAGAPDDAEPIFWKAGLRALQGNRVEALETLREAVRAGFRGHWFLRTSPLFHRYREDPLFTSFVDEMKRQAAIEHAKLPPEERGERPRGFAH